MSFQLAFPYDDHPPAQAAEAADVPAVVGHVPREFFGPVLLVALGGGGALASRVPVPEAAVDEDHGPVARQDDVRLAGRYEEKLQKGYSLRRKTGKWSILL